jgi:hypothetical protein
MELENSVLESMIKMFSWNADYYLTEIDPEMSMDSKGEFSKVVDKINVRVLIPDNGNDNHQINPKNLSTIEIPIREFVTNKEPRSSDIIFFPSIKRMYHVVSSVKHDDFFKVEIDMYCQKDPN